jgi:hypothetical protein
MEAADKLVGVIYSGDLSYLRLLSVTCSIDIYENADNRRDNETVDCFIESVDRLDLQNSALASGVAIAAKL